MSLIDTESEAYRKYKSLVDEMTAEFPNFAVIVKERSRFMKFLYYAGFMFLWNPRFMSNYITAIFGKVYMPERFIGAPGSYEVLRHERVHLRDARRWPILFELSYLLFPLPLVFSMRAYWEYRGYCESILAESQQLGYVRKAAVEYYISLFSAPDYLFMFPFPGIVRAKFYKFIERNHIKVI